MMSQIYLFLHKIMLIATDPTYEITKKQALHLISMHFKFIPAMKKKVLEDMITMGLLERRNRDWYKVINPEKSDSLDAGILLKVMESGEKYKNLFRGGFK